MERELLKRRKPACTAQVDRLRIVGGAESGTKLPWVPSFRVLRDSFVKQQSSVRTYLRCRTLLDPARGTQVFWQYLPQHRWLQPWRITFISNNQTGLLPEALLPITNHCPNYYIVLVEFAFDFDLVTGIDEDFVKRSALFGKSHPRLDRGGEGQLRYGTRSSVKLVRAYQKAVIDSYRIELELHSGLLRPQWIRQVTDLTKLCQILLPSHFQFVSIRWAALRRYLVRRFPEAGPRTFEGTRNRAESIHTALAYLRRRRIHNVHRFVQPIGANRLVREAAERWAMAFAGGAL